MSKTRTSKRVWLAAAATAAVAAVLVLPNGAAFASSVGSTSVASGNQVLVPLDLPVSICGLAVGVLGSAEASCPGGAVAKGVRAGGGNNTGGSGTNVGNTSVASGNKVSVPVSAPVDVCGLSIAILGTARSGCQGGSTVSGGGGPTHHKHHHRHQGKHHKTTTTSTTPKTPAPAAVLASSVLPTTGANLAGLAMAGLGCLGLGTGAVVAERRRGTTDET